MNCYCVYLLTNPKRTVLYTGVTNDLARRLSEHIENENSRSTFAGRYFCNLLVHWEEFADVKQAIAREKEIKGWRRGKEGRFDCYRQPGVERIKRINPWNCLTQIPRCARNDKSAHVQLGPWCCYWWPASNHPGHPPVTFAIAKK